jgi:hypothetical protein
VGQPAAHGLASGNVRVIRGPQDSGGFRAGERLVCDAIHPVITDLGAVRNAWSQRAICHLYTESGLPLGPFRTDNGLVLAAEKATTDVGWKSRRDSDPPVAVTSGSMVKCVEWPGKSGGRIMPLDGRNGPCCGGSTEVFETKGRSDEFPCFR